jgi:hypothetical protein
MRFRLRLAAPLCLAACATPTASGSADEPDLPTISTNRPSFSDSTSLVPANHLQVETGYTFTKRRRAGTATERHAVPEVLMRFRLLDRLETQVSWGGYLSQRSEAAGAVTDTEGTSDIGVGIRVPIEEQRGWMPTIALGASVTLGTGDDDFSTGDHAVPVGKVLWSYAFDGGFGLGGNLVFGYPHDGQQRFDQVAASVYGTYTLNDRASVFGEYFVVAPYANGTGPAHTVDGGVLYLLSRTVQLDARVGLGLNDHADHVFAGVGISVLF